MEAVMLAMVCSFQWNELQVGACGHAPEEANRSYSGNLGLDGLSGLGLGSGGHLGGGHVGTVPAMTASAMKSARRRTERMASSLAGMP